MRAARPGTKRQDAERGERPIRLAADYGCLYPLVLQEPPFSRTVERRDNLVQPGFKVDGALVVRLSSSLGAPPRSRCIGSIAVVASERADTVGQFLFETAKEGLDAGVIVATGFATSRRGMPGCQIA